MAGWFSPIHFDWFRIQSSSQREATKDCRTDFQFCLSLFLRDRLKWWGICDVMGEEKRLLTVPWVSDALASCNVSMSQWFPLYYWTVSVGRVTVTVIHWPCFNQRNSHMRLQWQLKIRLHFLSVTTSTVFVASLGSHSNEKLALCFDFHMFERGQNKAAWCRTTNWMSEAASTKLLEVPVAFVTSHRVHF